MKISPINSLPQDIKPQKKSSYSSLPIAKSEPHSGSINYNPIYYKPNISFKGEEFNYYFPSEILGISEDDFDNILKETLEDKEKKGLLSEYIVDQAAQYGKSMDFINMWKRQVPMLVSHNMMAMGSNSGAEVINKLINITAKNSATSALQRFNNSDYQSEILQRDCKVGLGGLLSYKLFTIASTDPEPYTKIGLYAAAFAVGVVNYTQASEDSKRIQDKQFIDATKDLIKTGALDPYALIKKIDKNKIELSPEKQEEYIKWKNEKEETRRYEKTGYVKDQHNDFNTEEARNVLKIVLATLKNNVGFDDIKIAVFLSFMAAQYASVHETKEAQYLMELATKIYETYAIDKETGEVNNYGPELYHAYGTLAYLQDQNEETNAAIKTTRMAEICAQSAFGVNSEEFYESNMQELEYIQKQRLKIDKMRPLINADREEAISATRNDKLSDLTYTIHEGYRSDPLEYLQYEAKNTIRNLLVLTQRRNKAEKDIPRLINLINMKQDEAIYDLFKENKELPTFITKSNDTDQMNYIYDNLPNIAEDLTEYTPEGKKYYLINNEKLHSQLRETLTALGTDITTQKLSLDNNVSQIFTIGTLLGKDFDEINKEIEEKFGEDSLEQAELFRLQYYKEKSKDKTPEREYRTYQRPYINYLFQNFRIIRDQRGWDDDKTMSALAEYSLENVSPFEISNQSIPIFNKYASPKLKEKYLSKLYARYAQTLQRYNTATGSILKSSIAVEGAIAYQKAIDLSKKPDPQLVYNFLNYLDLLYSHEIEDGAYTSYYDAPLLSELPQEKQRDYYSYLYWSQTKPKLKQIINTAVDPFMINHRKFLEMIKKHEPVFFQKRFDAQIDEEIKALERSTNVYEIK